MNRFDPQKIGGACAIVYAALVTTSMVLLAHSGIDDAAGAANFLPLLAAHHDLAASLSILFVIMPLLLAVAGIGIFRMVRGKPLAWLALFGFVAGGLSIVYRGFIWLAMTLELAPAYVRAGSTERITLGAVGDTLRVFSSGATMVGAGLVGGLGVLIFSLLIRQEKIGPRWLVWLGIFSSLIGGFLTLLTPMSHIVASISTIGDLGFFAWIAAVGAIAWRTPARVEPDAPILPPPSRSPQAIA